MLGKRLRAALTVALALTTAASMLPAGPAHAAAQTSASVTGSRPTRTYVTNGLVEAVTRVGDTVYIGGRFNRIGPRTGPSVELGLDGSEHAASPEVTGGAGSVSAVAPDGSGGWYIGGLFTHVGGVPRNNIAHIRADHSVDPAFDPNANDSIHALVLSGSTLYAGGLFTSIGGQTRNRIAGLNAATGMATAFNPDADAAIEALAASDSGAIIYAGGRFTTIGGQPRLSLAALNATDGSAASTFTLGATNGSIPSPGLVLALAISGSTLYVGGAFGTIGGQPRNNIAAFTLGGPQDGLITTFNPDARSGTCAACGSVDALVVSGSTVYAGGLFTSIGGVTRKYLAGINTTDGIPTVFDPSPNGNILGLGVSADGSTIYAAGGFNSYDGSPSIGGEVRNYVAAINADGTVAPFDPNPNGAAEAFGVSASAVYVGGGFSSIGGFVRNNVAAIDALDGTATSWDPNANREVFSLAASGSTMYLGGFFSSVGGATRNGIAAVNIADGSVTAFNPDAGPSASVYALAVSGSTVIAGGFFSTMGGLSRSNIAAVDTNGNATAWDPNANSGVMALVVSGPLVYAGGYFTSIGGQARNKIAALSLADGNATAWDPDPTSNANVLALAVSGSTVFAGGNFASMHGMNRKNLAALRISDGAPTGFNPQPNDGVFAVAVSGSRVFAGGVFSAVGGQPHNLIAELDPNTGLATSFDPGADPGFIAFALTIASDGTLYAGGSFRTFDLEFQQGIASFPGPPNLPPTARATANPATGTAPQLVTFDASTSSDPDSADSIDSYTFDFGDGSATVTQASATTSRTYTTPGAYTATITVADSHGLQSANVVSLAIQVMPTGTLFGLEATPSSLDFGNAYVGGSSSARAVSVRNAGSRAARVTGVTIDGANPGDFVLGVNACNKVTLSPGQTCTISSIFRPTSSGPLTTNLTVASTADVSTLTVALSGTGLIGSPKVSVTPATINAGEQLLGTSGSPKVFMLKNTGTGYLSVSSVTLDGANAADFVPKADACTGKSLAQGATCAVRYAFTPSELGARTANVMIVSNSTTPAPTVTLYGTGVSDTTPPSSHFDSAENDILLSANDLISGTITDSGSGVASAVISGQSDAGISVGGELNLDCNAGRHACTWSTSTPVLPGRYQLNVAGTDLAGNVESPGASITLVIL